LKEQNQHITVPLLYHDACTEVSGGGGYEHK
jgi:hypothetical protein